MRLVKPIPIERRVTEYSSQIRRPVEEDVEDSPNS
jgi:hypothetical protein